MKRAITKTNVCELKTNILFFFCFLLFWNIVKVSRDLCSSKKSCHGQKKENTTFLTKQILIRHSVLDVSSFSGQCFLFLFNLFPEIDFQLLFIDKFLFSLRQFLKFQILICSNFDFSFWSSCRRNLWSGSYKDRKSSSKAKKTRIIILWRGTFYKDVFWLKKYKTIFVFHNNILRNCNSKFLSLF